MSAHDEKSIQHLLRQAVPPVKADLEPEHDLWPAVRSKVNQHLDAHDPTRAQSKWIWFDWALAAGLAVVTFAFPASIPLLLYYL
jgi:hypothetical protein